VKIYKFMPILALVSVVVLLVAGCAGSQGPVAVAGPASATGDNGTAHAPGVVAALAADVNQPGVINYFRNYVCPACGNTVLESRGNHFICPVCGTWVSRIVENTVLGCGNGYFICPVCGTVFFPVPPDAPTSMPSAPGIYLPEWTPHICPQCGNLVYDYVCPVCGTMVFDLTR
jgi:predicted RNA-binding Zn-ribbon protein involved in translation (DUF1610 family)